MSSETAYCHKLKRNVRWCDECQKCGLADEYEIIEYIDGVPVKVPLWCSDFDETGDEDV